MKPTTNSKPSETATSSFKLLACGNDKGGVGKSTTTAAIADALMAMGYKVRLADGDHVNQTLSALLPQAEILHYKSDAQMDEFIGSILERDDDLTILDLPGDSGENLSAYFSQVRFDAFRDHGIRLMVGLNLSQDEEAVAGALSWADAFLGRAEFVSLANGRLTPPGQLFDLTQIIGGAEIDVITEGRMIYVPRFTETMVEQFARVKTAPSHYRAGGRGYKALGLSFLSCLNWASHHKAVVGNLVPHAPWLTGRPIPNQSLAAAAVAAQEGSELRTTVREKIALAKAEARK